MNHDEALGKSRELDRFLDKAARDLMPITDGEPIFSLSDLVADIRAVKSEIRNGVRRELEGMRDDLRANGLLAVRKVQHERSVARDEFTGLLGNEIVDTSQDPT